MIVTGVLILLLTSCHKDKVSQEPLKEIGELYGGGIIYDRVVNTSFITGKVESCIYSITSLEDISDSAPWGCSGTYIPCDGGSYEFWARNFTQTITDSCHQQGIAAQLCRNLTLNGYNDWWLPTDLELQSLFEQKEMVGGFTEGVYWSCIQMDSSSAFCVDFKQGIRVQKNKDDLLCVRAVRAVKTE